MSTTVPKHFDANLKNQLAQTEEVQIETRRPGPQASAHYTTIWVVVSGDDVFVRSVHGNAGRWYQEIRANPLAVLRVGGQSLAVRAILANDLATIAQVSDAYRRKYGTFSEMPVMVRNEVLPTTLRLEPQ